MFNNQCSRISTHKPSKLHLIPFSEYRVAVLYLPVSTRELNITGTYVRIRFPFRLDGNTGGFEGVGTGGTGELLHIYSSHGAHDECVHYSGDTKKQPPSSQSEYRYTRIRNNRDV